jgi:hypothetical protein
MLIDTEIDHILQDFPKFELSYETMIHKKVYNHDIMLAIPEGQKCFAWFTSYKEDNVCFIMNINENKQIISVKIMMTSFDDKLALGTVFYGTVFQCNKINCFSIEDVYYYRGQNYTNIFFSEKMVLLSRILRNEITQTALTTKYIIFGIPLIGVDFNLLLKEIELLPYKVSQIKFRFFDKMNSKKIVYIKYFKPGSKTTINNSNSNSNPNRLYLSKVVFKVIPDLEPDIYNLLVYKNGTEEYHDVAFIPDYKTSVMMNKLFRNIKENANLDALEESDDEGEFEDPREDKYVYLDRSFKMYCEYNMKFKRWVPVSLADKKEKIVTYSLLSGQNSK